MEKKPETNTEVKKRSKLFKWLARTFLLLVLLIILSPLILHIGFVQNWIGNKICNNLSEKTNSAITLGEVDFSMFKGIILRDLYISTPYQSQDTMAFIGEASTTLKENIISLLKNKANLKDINLFDTQLQIVTPSDSSQSNMASFLQALSPNQEKTDSKANPFSLDIRNLNLRNVAFDITNEDQSTRSSITLKEGHVALKVFDLTNDSIVIESLSLLRPTIDILKGKKNEPIDNISSNENIDTTLNESNSFYLNVGYLDIQEGAFKLFDPNKTNGEVDALDPNNLDIIEVQVLAKDFVMNDNDGIVAQIQSLKLEENNGFAIENLSIDSLRFNQEQLLLSGFALNTDESQLSDYLEFKFNDISDFSRFSKAINIDALMSNSEVTFSDLIYFFPDLKNSPFFKLNQGRRFKLSGKLNGTVDDLYANNFLLSIDNLIELSGTLSTINLTNASSALVNLYVDDLSTSMNNLKRIIPGFRPPEQFYKLDPISFTGDIEGFFNDFVIYGNLESSLGNVILDTRLDTRGGVNEASYSGEIFLNSFDLKTWSDNENLGLATLKASIQDGKGLTLESVKTDLNAELERFDFKGYEYSNIILEGILEKNLFDGQFSIKDPNVDLDFDGQLNIGDNYIKSDFKAQIEKIDPSALNLSTDYSMVTGNFDLSVEGSSVTDFIGSVDVKNLDLIYKEKEFVFEKLYLSSAPGGINSRNLIFSSDIMNASIDGDFNFAQLEGNLKNYIYNNHPGWAKRLNIRSNGQASVGVQNFTFKFEIFDTKDYLELANVYDLRFKNAKIYGKSALGRNSIDATISVDSSFYKDYVISGLGVDFLNAKELSSLLLNVDEISSGSKFYDPLKIKSDLINDNLNIQLSTSNVLDSVGYVDVSVNAKLDGENIIFNLSNQNLQMFSAQWDIDKNNQVIFGKEFIEINDFILTDGYRNFSLDDYKNKGVELNLNNFDFLLANGIINYDKIDFAGEGTVFARVADIFDKPQVVADIQIPEFTLNGVDYGSLSVRLGDDSGIINASVNLNRVEDAQMLLINAELNKESKKIEGSLQARNLVMNTFEFIINDGISETSGAADLNARIFGTLDNIKIDGSGNVKNGYTKINYIGALIGLGTETFKISEKFIDLTNVRLFDKFGNAAIMTGGLNHDLFKKFSSDLNMKSDKFLALDTEKIDNPRYYGIGIGAMNINYYGPFSKTDITIDAITGPGTILNIPIEDSQSDVSENFIKFFNREDIVRKKQQIALTESVKLEGVDVEMNLTITQDAQVNIIFDERRNDIIKGTGDGDLRITVSRNGDFDIYGSYEVEQGEYLFTALVGIVSKPFKVKRGGQIIWTGDPINANLNIEAAYDDLSVPVNVLLAEYIAPGSAIENESKKRTIVDLKLKIGGTLYKPTINFDMAFPELQGELRTYADSKMRILRDNEADLNEQVAGLIMFRSFLPTNSLGNVFASTNSVVETTYNTLSEFVSNQLSFFLSGLFQGALTENGFVSGIDFELGFTKSSGIFDETPQSDNYFPDEIEVHFKPRFQNDKWGFDYGTSFVNATGGQVTNYVIHDFILEYYLTSDRRLKLRAYGKWDKDRNLGQNEQKYGVGLSYRKEFGSITNLMDTFKEDVKSTTKIGDAQSSKSPEGSNE